MTEEEENFEIEEDVEIDADEKITTINFRDDGIEGLRVVDVNSRFAKDLEKVQPEFREQAKCTASDCSLTVFYARPATDEEVVQQQKADNAWLDRMIESERRDYLRLKAKAKEHGWDLEPEQEKAA